ncbi:MAG: 50S ribosomal protein L11 methyltransferase [Kiritimatiellae bacterium]|nr:50S ribosomal protein L11 methyltransferase [Kiritimatiellia bacterium]
MTLVSCSIPEQFVNPLFEVFDGGDFVLTSYRDIEERLTRMQLFFEDAGRVSEAQSRLKAAMDIVGISAPFETKEIPDEDWKYSYRRHFKTERISRRIIVRPPWEPEVSGECVITLDPGLAFGTGKHETTRACLEYIDELAGTGGGFLDMGCGSGILSIAAAKLGYGPVEGFDVDQEAVDASIANAAANGVEVSYHRFALGRKAPAQGRYDLVAANILAPLLVRFADEIVQYVSGRLIVSGILDGLYPEVAAAYRERGFEEISRRTIGEWTTGLLARKSLI